jgi:hypothetical protein
VIANTAHDDRRARQHTRAWYVLVAALALHVVDEAMTGFLDFYNPLVSSVRSRVWWFPMPTFSFEVWLAGLVVLVTVLASMGVAVRRGIRGMRPASYVLAAIMLTNGLGHLAGSLYVRRWLPGTTSAPLLVIASTLLIRSASNRRSAVTKPTAGSSNRR